MKLKIGYAREYKISQTTHRKLLQMHCYNNTKFSETLLKL